MTVGVDNALGWYAQAPGTGGSVCALVGDGDLGAAVTSAVRASAALHDLDLGPVVEVAADGDAATAESAVDDLARAACDAVVAAPPPGAAALAAARDAHAPEIADGDPWFLLGYLQAMATHQVLEREMQGLPPR